VFFQLLQKGSKFLITAQEIKLHITAILLLLGCVGEDPFGNFLLGILDQENVNLSLAQKCDTLFLLYKNLTYVNLAWKKLNCFLEKMI